MKAIVKPVRTRTITTKNKNYEKITNLVISRWRAIVHAVLHDKKNVQYGFHQPV